MNLSISFLLFGVLILINREIVASQRLQKNRAYQASVAAKKAETAVFGDVEEDEAKAFNDNIRK